MKSLLVQTLLFLLLLCCCHSTLDTLMRGQCQAFCTEKYGNLYTRKTRSGLSYKQYKCDENCQTCWMECDRQSPTREICLKGCNHTKLPSHCEEVCNLLFNTKDLIATTGQPIMCNCSHLSVASIRLLCMNLQGTVESPMVFGTFAIKLNDSSLLSFPIVYHIEARHKLFNLDLQKHTETNWFPLGKKTENVFSLKKMLAGMQYQFRVVSITSEGLTGDYVYSDWITTLTGASMIEAPHRVMCDQQWLDDGNQLKALVKWIPDSDYPSCYYHINWKSDENLQSRSFPVDEDMAYVIDRLDYDQRYTVTVRALSSLQAPRLESTSVVTEFYTESCLELNSFNFSICPPGPVGNLTVELMNETIGTGRVYWDAPKHISEANVIVGYALKFRTLPHLSPGCTHHIELLTDVFPNATEYLVEDLKPDCTYSVEVWADSEAGRGSGEYSQLEFPPLPSAHTDLDKELRKGGLALHYGYVVLIFLGTLFALGGLMYAGIYRALKNNKFASLRQGTIRQSQHLANLLSRALRPNTVYMPSSSIVMTTIAATEQSRWPNRTFSPPFSGSTMSQIDSKDSTDGSVITSEFNFSLPVRPQKMLTPVDRNLTNSTVPATFNRNLEIDMQKEIRLTCALGAGAFGQVFKADCGVPGLPHQVAVKQLKDGFVSPEAKRCLLAEIGQMQQLGPHPNVVCLLGYSLEEPISLVMEFCPDGDLRSFLVGLRQFWQLQKVGFECPGINRPDSDSGISQVQSPVLRDRIALDKGLTSLYNSLGGSEINRWVATFYSWAFQVTSAMEFLVERAMVHRDLAARNVLLSKGATVAKVSDFGLTRRGLEYTQMRAGNLPVKWLAPEALFEQKFSEQSDVWSFGILLWEIVTVGGTPYPNQSLPQVIELVRNHYRMPRPTNCSEELYAIMMNCWHQTPANRPTFNALKQTIAEILENDQGYLRLDLPEAAYYYNLTD